MYVTHGLQPALHTLVRGVAAGGLRFAVTLDRILAMSTPPPARTHDHPSGNELSVHGLVFGYGESAAQIVDGLDLDLPDGAHLAVVGPSGAGKSTLITALCGYQQASSGNVLINGTDFYSHIEAFRNDIGFVPREG